MTPSGEAELRAAAAGPAELEKFLASADFDPDMFAPADHAALSAQWAWLADIAGQGVAADHGGMVDDDLACVAPWGFDPARIAVPVLLLHGGRDRIVPGSHGEWLARHCPAAELRLCPEDGHISVLRSAAGALKWLREHAGGS